MIHYRNTKVPVTKNRVTRKGEGWMKIGDRIYVPEDKITAYKIYSQPVVE